MFPTLYLTLITLFHVNHSWDTAFSKFDLENPRSSVMGEVKAQSHKVGPTSFQLAISFMWYGFSKIWPWKFKVRVKAQDFMVSPTSYQLEFLLFQVNQLCQWTLKIQGHGWRWTVEITQLAQHPFNAFPFCQISISPTIPIVCLTTKKLKTFVKKISFR